MTAGQFFLCFLIIIILRESLTSSAATSLPPPPPMTLRDTSTISEAPSETPVQMLDILTRLDFSDGCVLSRSVSDKWKIDNDSLASPAGDLGMIRKVKFIANMCAACGFCMRRSSNLNCM
nr:hypothetical protein PHYPA_018407 [Physcomitrium patens]